MDGIETKEIKGFEVPYFCVETNKLAEAVWYCCLGCDSVYGGILIDPFWPLKTTVALHHRGAGRRNPDCLKTLYLKIDWKLIEARKAQGQKNE